MAVTAAVDRRSRRRFRYETNRFYALGKRAPVFVGLNAFVAMAACLFVVGEIRRVELKR